MRQAHGLARAAGRLHHQLEALALRVALRQRGDAADDLDVHTLQRRVERAGGKVRGARAGEAETGERAGQQRKSQQPGAQGRPRGSRPGQPHVAQNAHRQQARIGPTGPQRGLLQLQRHPEHPGQQPRQAGWRHAHPLACAPRPSGLITWTGADRTAPR